jgi:carboxypeptidase family protein
MRVSTSVAPVMLVLSFASTKLPAQSPAPQPVINHPAAIGGRVLDIYGHPLPAAVVRADSAGLSATVDDSGRFLLNGLPQGVQRISATRVGFAPVSFNATLTSDSTLAVVIHMQPVASLPTVTTTAKLNGRSAKLDGIGFFDRQQHAASGFFITPDDIAAMPWATDPALFLASAPGVTMTKRQARGGGCSSGGKGGRRGGGGGGGGGCQKQASGYAIAFPATDKITSGSTTCKPNVFVDGAFTPLPLGQAVSANDVYAIEVYTNAATVPASFQAPMSEHACGSLVVWTKKYAP